MPPDLATTLARFARTDGLHPAPVPGVHCVRYAHTDRRTRRQWRACLAIVAQGCKEVALGRETYRCGEGRYTAAPVLLPVVSRIAVASPERPFLGLLIDLDPLIVGDVAAQMGSDDRGAPASASRALFSGAVDGDMRDAATRLARVFQTPDRARVVGPLIVRELFYDLLKGPDGAAIRQFVSAGTAMHRIANAVFAIRTSLHQPVDVGVLATASGMSRSAFFQHFRDAMAMSPIQYQKRLRLLEARRLMVDEHETAERASFGVGYRSASQFSREYLRMFGVSPRRDAAALRRTVSYRAS
ncbi:MAG: AraC family transcriptional regulator, partial [Vicinamibacteraceae bacterium]